MLVVVVVVLVASLLFVPSLTKSDSSQSSAHQPTRLHHWRLIIDQFPSTFLHLPAANHLLPTTTTNANQSCFHFIEIIGKLDLCLYLANAQQKTEVRMSYIMIIFTCETFSPPAQMQIKMIQLKCCQILEITCDRRRWEGGEVLTAQLNQAKICLSSSSFPSP